MKTNMANQLLTLREHLGGGEAKVKCSNLTDFIHMHDIELEENRKKITNILLPKQTKVTIWNNTVK